MIVLRVSWVLLLTLLAVAAGCASGPKLDSPALTTITEQRTTRAEIERLLGKPHDAAQGENGKTLLVYLDHDRKWGKLMQGEILVEFQAASFLFDDGGVLEKKLIKETSARGGFDATTATMGEPITEEKLQQLKVDETRFDEVVALLGAPLIEVLTLEGDIRRHWMFGRERSFSRSDSRMLIAIFDYETNVLMDFGVEEESSGGR